MAKNEKICSLSLNKSKNKYKKLTFGLVALELLIKRDRQSHELYFKIGNSNKSKHFNFDALRNRKVFEFIVQ